MFRYIYFCYILLFINKFYKNFEIYNISHSIHNHFRVVMKIVLKKVAERDF